MGDALADELMYDSQERGNRVHSAVEQLLCGEEVIENVAEEDLPFILGFVNWWNGNDVLLLETELFLESKKYQYRGRTDLIVLLEGEEWIIDIKTGKPRWSHAYQLKFYEQAYFEMTGQRCRMGVLGLTNKTKQGFHRLAEFKKPLYNILALKLVFDDISKSSPIKQPIQQEAVVWTG